MQTSERSRAIAESVINMAHTLRLLVVDEGVETKLLHRKALHQAQRQVV